MRPAELADCDDLTLLERAREQDTAAFAQLVRRHQNAALRVAAVICGSTTDAEDVVQDAMVDLHRHLASYRVILATVALIPDSRHAVARWFGLDRVRVDVDPAVTGTAAPITFDLPGPGQSRVVEVDGRQILVSTIDGTLTPVMINKSAASSIQVQLIDVDGAPGIWIDGAAHEIGYESPPGHIVFERMAGNTLVWQRDEVITRVEGFADLDAALAFARQAESGT